MRQRIIGQFSHPKGAAGQLAGWIMANRGSNRKRNQWTIELLALQPQHRVLEIGFGPGIGLQFAAEVIRGGKIVGVDHSEVMLRQAEARNREAVRQGRIQLVLASAEELPDFGLLFDRIYSVNSAMFWKDPLSQIRNLCRLLAAGGCLALTVQPRQSNADEATATAVGEQLSRQMLEAGLSAVRVERLPLKPVSAVCVLGFAPASTQGRLVWAGV